MNIDRVVFAKRLVRRHWSNRNYSSFSRTLVRNALGIIREEREERVLQRLSPL